MSTFTDANVPCGSSGASSRAAIEYAKAYDAMRSELSDHKENISESYDPHGIKAYIKSLQDKVNVKAAKALSKVEMLEGMLAGGNLNTSPAISSAQYMINMLGLAAENKDLITFIKGLVDRIKELESTVDTLSLLQFDNVPVGAGIRWYRNTLPEDGTYVWANGQTLYGVNQNFPELVRAWELGSADNVKVPKEEHTIFKVRKADRKITAVQHAYIEAANGEVPTTLADVSAAIATLAGNLATLQTAVETLQGA